MTKAKGGMGAMDSRNHGTNYQTIDRDVVMASLIGSSYLNYLISNDSFRFLSISIVNLISA